MTTTRIVATLGLVLALAACGERGGTGSPGASPTTEVELPDEASALVLQIAATGGYVSPTTTVSRFPVVSVHRDGRVFTQGPVAAIYPPFAWPDVQVAQLDDAAVQRFADAASAAGVAETTDLGMPNVADATSTTFTLVTAGQTYVRDVYALQEGIGDDALTTEQQEARGDLLDLLDLFTGPEATTSTTAYQPTAVAAIAEPYVEPVEPGGGPEFDWPEIGWPGPELPGEPAGPGIGCVVATGEQATAVAAAAQGATGLTPWTSGGSRWSVVFRPLLPDETGCADLTG